MPGGLLHDARPPGLLRPGAGSGSCGAGGGGGSRSRACQGAHAQRRGEDSDDHHPYGGGQSRGGQPAHSRGKVCGGQRTPRRGRVRGGPHARGGKQARRVGPGQGDGQGGASPARLRGQLSGSGRRMPRSSPRCGVGFTPRGRQAPVGTWFPRSCPWCGARRLSTGRRGRRRAGRTRRVASTSAARRVAGSNVLGRGAGARRLPQVCPSSHRGDPSCTQDDDMPRSEGSCGGHATDSSRSPPRRPRGPR